MTLDRGRILFVGSLLALMLASALFGWRANITFEPTPYRYIPVHYRHPIGWHANDWMIDR